MKIAVLDKYGKEMDELMSQLNTYFLAKRLQTEICGFFRLSDMLKESPAASIDLLLLVGGNDVGGLVYSVGILRRNGFSGLLVVVGDKCLKNAACAVGANGMLPRSACLDDVKKVLSRIMLNGDILLFRRHGQIIRINSSDITFIESSTEGCVIHLFSGDVHICQVKISSLEETLRENFMRCHRCYIVNMDHVISFGREVCLDTGDRVLASRAVKSTYFQYLERYADRFGSRSLKFF